MAAPNPISQDDIFFIGVWSREVESMVLSKLDFEQWNKNWIVGDIENNKQILRLVWEEVNEELDVDIPFPSCLAKLQEWEERYHQFRWLIARPGVFYHPLDNTVEASVDVWFEISRIRPNLLVYRPKGEPCWEQMRVLFRETIVLSDTHSGGNARSGDRSQNECVSEVVNQPSASNRTYKGNDNPSRSQSLSQRSSSRVYSPSSSGY